MLLMVDGFMIDDGWKNLQVLADVQKANVKLITNYSFVYA